MVLPVLEAVVCYLKKEGKTLLIDYRNFPHPLHKGFYSAPGGKLETGESREDAVIREIEEEINVKLNEVIYRGKVFFNNEKRLFGGKPAKHSYVVYYFDSLKFDESKALATEGSLAWTIDKEVNNLPMHKGDKQIWEWLKKYQEIEAEILESEDGFIDSKLISFKF